ncbi:hypothetical protein [Sorangium sp. So ce131]|uniref:hypothetical protein n=1 Tax=Sorangium sp. So ce131 TaxID=3133282 RepID=UPI003F5E7A49
MPTFTDTVLPGSADLDIGSPAQRWNHAFIQRLDAIGASTFTGPVNRVYMVSHATPGDDLGEKIAHAIGELPEGGVIDCRALTGSQVIGETVDVHRPVHILFGAVTIDCEAAVAFSIRAELWIEGMRGQSTLIAAVDGTLFDGKSMAVHCRFFRCEGMILKGGRSRILSPSKPLDPDVDPTVDSSRCFVTPDSLADPKNLFAGGQYQFLNNIITGFGSYAFQLGRSTYFVTICFNNFTYNVGDIKFDRYSELEVYANQFQWCAANRATDAVTVQDKPRIYAAGSSATSIHENDFELNWHSNRGVAPTGPDIHISPKVDGDGYILIRHNKFGGEGENAGRVKIRVEALDETTGARTSKVAENIRVEGNTFIGLGGEQTCIELLTPLGQSSVSDNYFSGFATLVHDRQELSSIAEKPNNNVFVGNRVYYVSTADSPPRPPVVFTKGGRGFAVVEDPLASIDARQRWRPVRHEAAELRNRLPDSEGLSGDVWSGVGTGPDQVSVTPAGLGPTNANAFKLERNSGPGANGAINIFALIDRTNLGKQVVVSFWAKAGTASDLTVTLHDVPGGLHEFKTFNLTDRWEYYAHCFAGLNPDAAFTRFRIYPSYKGPIHGTVYVSALQVSDEDTPYLPTKRLNPQVAALEPRAEGTYGARHGKPIDLAGGLRIGPEGALVKQLAVHTGVMSSSPGAVGPNSTAEATLAVPGLSAADAVLSVSKPLPQDGLHVVGWRVGGPGELAVTFTNSSSGSITPTPSESYSVVVLRT